MSQNTLTDLEPSSPETKTAAPPGSPGFQDALPFTPIEVAFLKLFGHDAPFGGIAPAMTEVVDALQSAHRVYGLKRIAMWAACQ